MMSVKQRFPLLVILLLVGAGTGIGDARGCNRCSMLAPNPFAVCHPRAIELAVATRQCIDRGVIEKDPVASRKLLEANRLVVLDKISAGSLLKHWSTALKPASRRRGPIAIHLLFTDTNELCELQLRGDLVLFQAKPAMVSESRIVTTRTAFYAIAAGRMSVRNALREGILLIEADSTAMTILGPKGDSH